MIGLEQFRAAVRFFNTKQGKRSHLMVGRHFLRSITMYIVHSVLVPHSPAGLARERRVQGCMYQPDSLYHSNVEMTLEIGVKLLLMTTGATPSTEWVVWAGRVVIEIMPIITTLLKYLYVPAISLAKSYVQVNSEKKLVGSLNFRKWN